MRRIPTHPTILQVYKAGDNILEKGDPMGYKDTLDFLECALGSASLPAQWLRDGKSLHEISDALGIVGTAIRYYGTNKEA